MAWVLGATLSSPGQGNSQLSVNAASSKFLEPHKAEGFDREGAIWEQLSTCSTLLGTEMPPALHVAYRVFAHVCTGCGVLARACTLQFHLGEQIHGSEPSGLAAAWEAAPGPALTSVLLHICPCPR